MVISGVLIDNLNWGQLHEKFLITTVAGMFFYGCCRNQVSDAATGKKEQKRMLFGCWYPRVSKHRLSAAADCACWHLTKLYRDWGKLELYKKTPECPAGVTAEKVVIFSGTRCSRQRRDIQERGNFFLREKSFPFFRTIIPFYLSQRSATKTEEKRSFFEKIS